MTEQADTQETKRTTRRSRSRKASTANKSSTGGDTGSYQGEQQQLEYIKELAKEIAQAFDKREEQKYSADVIKAVTKYGEIASALLVSTQADPAASGDTGNPAGTSQ